MEDFSSTYTFRAQFRCRQSKFWVVVYNFVREREDYEVEDTITIIGLKNSSRQVHCVGELQLM